MADCAEKFSRAQLDALVKAKREEIGDLDERTARLRLELAALEALKNSTEDVATEHLWASFLAWLEPRKPELTAVLHRSKIAQLRPGKLSLVAHEIDVELLSLHSTSIEKSIQEFTEQSYAVSIRNAQ